MELLIPNPPVTRSLLELLAVDNTVPRNDLSRFVAAPRPFTAKAAAEYMAGFHRLDTFRSLLGR